MGISNHPKELTYEDIKEAIDYLNISDLQNMKKDEPLRIRMVALQIAEQKRKKQLKQIQVRNKS